MNISWLKENQSKAACFDYGGGNDEYRANTKAIKIC